MSASKYLNLIQEWTAQVDAFQLDKPKKALKALEPTDIPKDMRQDFAKIARRCHLYNEAIRILQPNIYGATNPTQGDVFEYASSIRKIGLVRQSKKLLERSGIGKEQELYKAYADIHEWDYGSARLHLKKYISDFSLTEREHIVAYLNLSSCSLFLGLFDEASKELGQLSQINSKDYFQFYLNYKELLGQFHLLQGDFKTATTIFAEALKLTGEQQGNTSLFIKKWQIITDAAAGEEDISQINNLKREIRKSLHWESLRDFDYHIARFQKNTELLKNVYFSTPYSGYRDRMCSQTGFRFDSISNHTLTRGSGAEHFDPLTTFCEDLPPGMLLHRLLLLFLSDAYRPWSIPRIFDYLFCDEIYNPATSPKKIYALTSKLQNFLEAHLTGLKLDSTIYGYRLRLKENSAVTVYPKMIFENRQTVVANMLKNIVGTKTFSVADLENVVPLSKHKIYRFINEIKDDQVI
ncbi:MAG: hypothetical protein IT287_07710, partial [Bdellovibrionaceae bacterium]|nr:hypothetical protein [Pseudobdellovibrionaceae bacterium]